MKRKKLNRWLKALEIARCMFEADGYHTVYLKEIEDFIKRDAHLTGKENGNGFQKEKELD